MKKNNIDICKIKINYERKKYGNIKKEISLNGKVLI